MTAESAIDQSMRLHLKLKRMGRFLPRTILRANVSMFCVLLVLSCASPSHAQQHPPVAELLHAFETTNVFWRQLEIAKAIVAANDTRVLPKLQSWLIHEDRHLRGNAALIFAGLGHQRGFDVITAILRDYSERPQGQGIPGGRWSVQGQIRADRYYAAHLLGDLKDSRAVPILVALLNDPDVNYIVPWSLGQIGHRSAVQPLIGALNDRNPDMRVLAIHALVELKAHQSLPALRLLLNDNERSKFDKMESVAEAARTAMVKLQQPTER